MLVVFVVSDLVFAWGTGSVCNVVVGFHSVVCIFKALMSLCVLFCRTIFKSCPRLHTLRLQHLCVPSMYPSNSFDLGPSPLRVGDVGPDKYVLPPVLSCGCGQLSEKGFAAVRWHCSDLSSVTLVLQVRVYGNCCRSSVISLTNMSDLFWWILCHNRQEAKCNRIGYYQ